MRISDWSSDVCSSDLRLPTAFDEVLEQRVIEGGWEPGPMRDAYLDCERAWMSELPTLKMDLLDFRDIGDWLDLAEKIGLRGEMLDWFDKQFDGAAASLRRSEEHTSELQSLMRISYAVFCLKKKNTLL